MSILGRTWTINAATAESPFSAGTSVELMPDPLGAVVRYGLQEWWGTYNAEQDKVSVTPQNNERWEFVGSATMNDELTMFGFRWIATAPDTMGAWVSDPQGAP